MGWASNHTYLGTPCQGARPLRATDLVLLVPSEAADEIQREAEESPEKLRRDRIGIPCDATSIICIGFFSCFLRMWSKGW